MELLQPNATLISGDKEFYNFRNVTQTGNAVNLEDIFIIAIVGGPGLPENEAGIRFQTAAWNLIGANLSYSLSLDYNVRTTSGLPLIDANTLRLTGGRFGNGSATVTEEVLENLTAIPVTTKQVSFGPGGATLQHHVAYPEGPYAALEIQTEFSLATGDPTGAVPIPRTFVSHFDQTFTPIPESQCLMGAAFVALSLLRRNRQTRVDDSRS